MNPISFNHLQLGKQGQLLKKNFTINRPQTLFGPDWSALKDSRCPHCFNKLKFSYLKSLYICSSKKHLKSFVISKSKLDASTRL